MSLNRPSLQERVDDAARVQQLLTKLNLYAAR
jgi:hypothetical protein